jgi:hypothetical protein
LLSPLFQINYIFPHSTYTVEFINHGGYTKQERLSILSEQKLYLEVDKLNLELKELQKQFPDNTIVERLLSLGANIATIISRFAKY